MGSSTDGVWEDDYNMVNGTWTADMYEETLRHVVIEDDSDDYGYSMGEPCMMDDDCEGDLICMDVLTEDGVTTELRCGFNDYEDPEEMYAGEDEYCGYTNTTAGEDGYIMCMDGLVCQAVEDPTATETYGFKTICVNDTTDYGEDADGAWDGGETGMTGFWTNTGSGGTWVSGDGMMRGDWTYDVGT